MPSIRSIDTHSECWRLARGPGDLAWFGRPGDVKRCEHGKIMVRTQLIGGRIAGPGTDYWRTLSPIWDPILYRRAKKALQ